MDYHTRRIGTNVLLVRDGLILLPRRINTVWANNELAIPGGHLEEGESAKEAAVREIEEELGLKFSTDRLKFFTSASVRTNYEYIFQEFYVDLRADETPTIQEPDKCSELVWCDPKNLPDDVQDTFRVIIEKGYINGECYLEIGY